MNAEPQTWLSGTHFSGFSWVDQVGFGWVVAECHLTRLDGCSNSALAQNQTCSPGFELDPGMLRCNQCAYPTPVRFPSHSPD
eukprot:2634723-Rhodomonas_salina.2